jgi:hypothetical protein
MMLGSEVVAALGGIEARFPVVSWRCGDLAVWPLVRIALMARAYAAAVDGTGPNARGRIARHLAMGGVALAELTASGEDHRRLSWEACQRRCRLMMLSDGLSLVNLDGRLYERCLGPFAELAEDLGARSVMLMPKSVSGPLAHRWHPIASRLLLASVLHRHPATVHLPGYNEAMVAAGHSGLRPLAMGDAIVRAARVLAMRGFFVRLLRSARPNLVAVTSYYEVPQQAMIAACRRVGVPSMDVQHGFIHRGHAAYHGWTRCPPRGWDLLPDWVWSWGRDDAVGVKDWAPTGRHASIPGGNLLLDMFRSGNDGRTGRAIELARSLLPMASRRVLVSLQPEFDGREYFDLLGRMIADAPLDWGFLIRTHPGHPPGTIERMTRIFRAPRCEVESSSTLPLYAILQATDVHITHCSSVVLEAAAFGIGSVVFDRLGDEAFGRLPCTRFAEDVPSILVALAELAGGRFEGSSGASARRLSQARITLAKLLSGIKP